MQQHLLVSALAALIPLLVGFLWYNKMLFGKTWMQINRFTDADMKGGNMALVFGLTYLFSFMLAFFLSAVVIHQSALHSIVANDHSDAAKKWLDDSMTAYGRNFRTFKHGMFHGLFASICFVLPVLGIVAMFERRGAKYVMIHLGFWAVCLMLMGGIICQWA